MLFSLKDEYVKTTDKLRQRLDSAKTEPGSQSFHYVRLLADTKKLKLKQFLISEDSQLYPPARTFIYICKFRCQKLRCEELWRG